MLIFAFNIIFKIVKVIRDIQFSNSKNLVKAWAQRCMVVYFAELKSRIVQMCNSFAVVKERRRWPDEGGGRKDLLW